MSTTPNPSPGYSYTGSKVPSELTKTGASIALGSDGTNYLALQLDSDGNLKTATQVSMSIDVGDVEIGAVEIKNADSDARAKVLVVSGSSVSDIGLVVTDPVVSASIALISKEEDIAHASGDKGIQMLAVRKDAGTSFVDADGDYAPLMVNASGMLNINFDQIRDVAPDIGTGVADSGTLRVAVARDPKTLYASSAYESGSVVKTSAGTLFALWGYNSNASSQFIQVHNTAAMPAEAAAPSLVFKVPTVANFYFDVGGQNGIYYDTGITICNSSTAPTKTSGSADCWINAVYE